MSIETKNKKPKDLFFDKSDRKTLLKYLEKLYVTKLNNFNWNFQNLPPANKTRASNYERRFRLEVKAIETLLLMLGSEFMSNVKKPNFRKTTEINARTNGLIQSERQIMDNPNS
jgi:hypothetical protein